MYIAKILKNTLFIIKNNYGENLMVKYKDVLLLFFVYLALSLVGLYTSLIFIPNLIYITFISQAGAIFISLIVFSIYLKAWKNLEIFTNLINLLNENSNWELIQKPIFQALRLKASKNEKTSRILLFLVITSFLLIIISFTMNLIMLVKISYYIIPVFFTIFLVILNLISKISENPSKKLISWIYNSYRSLDDEYLRLKQFKVEGTEDYFNKISSNLSNLSNLIIPLQDFVSSAPTLPKNNVLNSLFSLQGNFKNIHKLIQDIYEIRGKLITLMTVILELRQNQVLRFNQLDQMKKSEVEIERLKNLEQKETSFKNLEKLLDERKIETENAIEETFSMRSKEITDSIQTQFDELKELWNGKISEFQQKISQVYTTNYQKFGTLNEELKDNYQTLQSKATSLFFEKFYQGLIESVAEERSIESYFEEFLFVADIFFSETISKLERTQLSTVMEKLCLIHESME